MRRGANLSVWQTAARLTVVGCGANACPEITQEARQRSENVLDNLIMVLAGVSIDRFLEESVVERFFPCCVWWHDFG
jgi:hypothetical protein